ncbi:phosphotransferase [Nocardia transvalensis]|uniref:phosphotransferase n=1 Tax=Nocardia transvalensis TaxID=37333 RepID=UPI0018943721|nr:phosphotransferase [Nocardia transvalensis]MBF6330915.1 aminoglycoside phosphotransferase family protein [Nocardia transvalensis]
MFDGELGAALVRLGREAGGNGEPESLSERADAAVVRVGEIVVKAHPADTDEAALRSRLTLAADSRLRRILMAPIAVGGHLFHRCAGRLVTVWPYGRPVDPDDPDAAPWEQAAALLAQLHSVAIRPGRIDAGRPDDAIPEAGGPARVRRALARLRAAPQTHPSATAVVWRAYETLPDLTAAPKTLVHGDFHLGQLISLPEGENPWRLVDVDDLGMGEPVWDLARPAAFFAAGILEPDAWERFLGAYRRRGGPAVPLGGDAWEVLDVPARALVVQAAALAVAKAEQGLDEFDIALIDSCRRMATLTYGG